MVDRPDVALDDLYREVVMDHHRHPHGRAPLGRVDATAQGFNPVCGDEVVISLALDGDRVTGAQVQGRGCAICTASGSMMAEMIPGHTAAEAEATAEAFRAVMHGAPAPTGVDLGDLEALEGVQKFAVRVKCAMLPWVTLTDALKAWRSGRTETTSSTEAPEATR
ncbi:MAG: SUF system NifU family Fe-S cluster assembly protein [Acidobacteria bacterium 21-70-11]|nr:MAG: SUF system NifU family Fe-S cluster assembly protein [Acidobacteria bacterium 21-70-11]OYW06343.1 MAG: SUF system NifU family Fe-S cluster assembly protein [Acidobacteria bacterium 37-71-11]HQT94532.1 SUF system NifU family Fe-S cluster assembly protein [Thermoanaerobaculaceae bacterium]HQU32891.1 SUF system NifU family Fe-S cluster assembly protein [Thermoanaerobaculaceae bacterium]